MLEPFISGVRMAEDKKRNTKSIPIEDFLNLYFGCVDADDTWETFCKKARLLENNPNKAVKDAVLHARVNRYRKKGIQVVNAKTGAKEMKQLPLPELKGFKKTKGKKGMRQETFEGYMQRIENIKRRGQ